MVDDARAEVNAVGWTLGAISTVIIALRIYARTVLASKFGWDDGLMVLAWVCCTPCLLSLSTSIESRRVRRKHGE